MKLKDLPPMIELPAGSNGKARVRRALERKALAGRRAEHHQVDPPTGWIAWALRLGEPAYGIEMFSLGEPVFLPVPRSRTKQPLCRDRPHEWVRPVDGAFIALPYLACKTCPATMPWPNHGAGRFIRTDHWRSRLIAALRWITRRQAK